MDCSKIKKLLGAYYDDELSGKERLEVERHLAECESCRNELTSFSALDKIVHKLKVSEPSKEYWPDLTRRISARLPQQQKLHIWEAIERFLRRPAFVMQFASAIAVAVLIFVIVRNVSVTRYPGIRSAGEQTNRYLFSRPAHKAVDNEAQDLSKRSMTSEKIADSISRPTTSLGSVAKKRDKASISSAKDSEVAVPPISDLQKSREQIWLKPEGKVKGEQPHLGLAESVGQVKTLASTGNRPSPIEEQQAPERKSTHIAPAPAHILGQSDETETAQGLPDLSLRRQKHGAETSKSVYLQRYDYAKELTPKNSLIDTLNALKRVIEFAQEYDLKGDQLYEFFTTWLKGESGAAAASVSTKHPNSSEMLSRHAVTVQVAKLYSELAIVRCFKPFQPNALQFYRQEKATLIDSLGNDQFQSLLQKLQ